MKSNKFIDYDKIDKNCIPLVKYFNQIGLTTSMCCEGHNNRNMSLFWIEFDKSISDHDILQFMKSHSHKAVRYSGEILDSFIPNGKFVKRAMPIRDSLYFRWWYIVGTSEAANADLETWKRIDNGEILWNGPSYIRLEDRKKYLNSHSKHVII